MPMSVPEFETGSMGNAPHPSGSRAEPLVNTYAGASAPVIFTVPMEYSPVQSIVANGDGPNTAVSPVG